MVAGIEGPRFSGAQFVQHAVVGVVWRKTEFFRYGLGLQRPLPGWTYILLSWRMRVVSVDS